MSTASLDRRARVLCLSGHDPGGGAGIHADLEAVAAQGAHALTVITALTAQDSVDVRQVWPVASARLAEQLELLLADGAIAAIKIGLLGDATQIAVIVDAIRRSGAPVVCDPVLRAGGGRDLSDAATIAALLDELLPHVDLLTPNAAEARRLSGCNDPFEAAAALRARGCRQVLVTGGDEAEAEVHNRWLDAEGRAHEFRWPRLPARFHGAGCTLAAAIAARRALGEDWATAVEAGQRYTQQALAGAYRAGRGRLIPRRSGR
ncbi:bifunctional hydroxymethylpyrimidine kinase/phosphomethylpyrimidine kinase [Solimonas soli]|uniref:bifunctional hydroxymethylpyrimidine kinase/phosphomethylpyrimidine kinase n=1 Tax=Solimonas soli TaxID=413479 RepID=UPI0004810671|nr:hydroxymethylpyrimidine/phosphomethylpyrimidine kinase [Solimonas soli]